MEDLKKIRKVQIKMDHLATDILAGMYRSAFKGRGMEFEEVREFQPGDEIRSIDWNVTARMGTPFVKLFREEREMTLYLVLDISGSTEFGSQNALKRTILSEIGAVFAFSGIKNQDKIGLVLYTDQVEHYVPCAKGIRHVLRIIRDLMAFQGKSKKTDLTCALNLIAKIQKKRAVVLLLSDYLSSAPLSVFAKKHDLIALCVEDPLEKKIPSIGLLRLKDLETGKEITVDTSSKTLNPFLERIFQKRVEEIKHNVEKNGGAFIQVSTDKPYITALKKFFLKKGRK